jgi:hypothetical protein
MKKFPNQNKMAPASKENCEISFSEKAFFFFPEMFWQRQNLIIKPLLSRKEMSK